MASQVGHPVFSVARTHAATHRASARWPVDVFRVRGASRLGVHLRRLQHGAVSCLCRAMRPSGPGWLPSGQALLSEPRGRPSRDSANGRASRGVTERDPRVRVPTDDRHRSACLRLRPEPSRPPVSSQRQAANRCAACSLGTRNDWTGRSPERWPSISPAVRLPALSGI